MAVFTFSTRDKRPEDTEAIKKAKQYCEEHNLNFSAVVVELIKEYFKDVRSKNS